MDTRNVDVIAGKSAPENHHETDHKKEQLEGVWVVEELPPRGPEHCRERGRKGRGHA